jgi:secondary thiamine-phosphate synthase enzyme
MTHPAQSGSRAFVRALEVKTSRRTELLDVTAEVRKAVSASGVRNGICHLYVPHTTAGVTINEKDDPAVPRDIEAALDRMVPKEGPYKHNEGNADAHIKSTLAGVSCSVEIEDGRLALGRWQAIFFCEFDGPRQRQLRIRIAPD